MVSVPMLTTLGMTRSIASTVASRRASASAAPTAGWVRTPLSHRDTAAHPAPGNVFQLIITLIVNTTNRLQVRSI
jgi:hypothetical protein